MGLFDDPPPGPESGTPKTYTVSQLVRLAARQLEARFGDLWVEGEVSNLRSPSSGHLYFTLKDSRAQLAVVMFRATASRLKFRVEDGLALRCRGKLSIYDVQGRFQLTVESAEPAGAGAQQLALEQLRRRLEAEGLFDPARKRRLPLLPRQIVIVTSLTGAALRDIVRVLHDRCPVRVVVCPTPVQGSEAPAEIAAALRRADRRGADVIVLGRGGGSSEDLSAFNSEGVARASFASRTPVISAVGHEVDVTIADLVADHRAPTPTAAAELAVPVMAEVQQQQAQQRARLLRAALQRLRDAALSLERLRRRLGSPVDRVNRSRMRLDDATARLATLMLRALGRRRETFGRERTRLASQEPRARLARHRAALGTEATRLSHLLRLRLEHSGGELARAAARLQALSPLAVLARGYGLVQDAAGAVVRDIHGLRRGSPLLVRLQQGELHCTVERVVAVELPRAPLADSVDGRAGAGRQRS
jgi:exodeoxyribonuclease VII large subunit